VLERLRGDLGTTTHRELLRALHCDVVDLRVEIIGAGVGNVLAPSHVLRLDVPTADVLAMRDAALDYRYEGGVPRWTAGAGA
jgi:hypothetical protein